MMRMTQGWNWLRTAVVALGLFAWSATATKADVISNLLDYSTAGSINYATGVTGVNVISYVPVTNASIDPTSNLPLGSFQVAALPTGQSTTYNNTPFSITLSPSSYNNTPLNSNTPVVITGSLNGKLTGSYQSSVNVTFNPVTDGAFGFAGANSTLSVLQNDKKLLVPASAGGTTTIEGVLTTTGLGHGEAPVPEPTTIALFLSTIGGLGLRRFVAARRRRRQA
jgi:hypothetical protein